MKLQPLLILAAPAHRTTMDVLCDKCDGTGLTPRLLWDGGPIPCGVKALRCSRCDGRGAFRIPRPENLSNLIEFSPLPSGNHSPIVKSAEHEATGMIPKEGNMTTKSPEAQAAFDKEITRRFASYSTVADELRTKAAKRILESRNCMDTLRWMGEDLSKADVYTSLSDAWEEGVKAMACPLTILDQIVKDVTDALTVGFSFRGFELDPTGCSDFHAAAAGGFRRALAVEFRMLRDFAVWGRDI